MVNPSLAGQLPQYREDAYEHKMEGVCRVELIASFIHYFRQFYLSHFATLSSRMFVPLAHNLRLADKRGKVGMYKVP